MESADPKPAPAAATSPRTRRKSPPARKARGAQPRNGAIPAPVRAALAALESAAQGEWRSRVPIEGLPPRGEATRLARLVNQVLDRGHAAMAGGGDPKLASAISRTTAALLDLVHGGDLTQWRSECDSAVLSPLVGGIGRVVEMLRTFVRETSEAALRLSSSAHEVLAASTQHESASTEQGAAIHETTATMEELKHASAQIAENAGSVARVAEETLGAARAGRSAISDFAVAMQNIRSDGLAVVDSIAKLTKRVERIGTVVEVIDEIADRSDLLALNAALEGSRAGEAGKGFSIVAAEMRRLAENVMESTKEIKNLIAEIREATQSAAGAADASRRASDEGERLGSLAAQAVEGILSGIQETNDAARVINLATQQQRTATEQVVTSMAEIEDVTRQTTQASKQATSAASELTDLAGRLGDLIKRFQVD